LSAECLKISPLITIKSLVIHLVDEVDKWEPKPLEEGEVDKEEQVKPKTPKPKASRLQKVKDLMKDEGEVAADGAAIVPVEGTLIND